MMTSLEFLNSRQADGTLAAHGVGYIGGLTQSKEVWATVKEILGIKDLESSRWVDSIAWEFFVMGWNAGTEIYEAGNTPPENLTYTRY